MEIPLPAGPYSDVYSWRRVYERSFIVGFPGEQDEDFQQLLDFVAEAQINHVGCFAIHKKKGLPPERFPTKFQKR